MMTAHAALGGKHEAVRVKFLVDVIGVEQYPAIPSVIGSSRAEPHTEDEAPRSQHGLQFLEAPLLRLPSRRA